MAAQSLLSLFTFPAHGLRDLIRTSSDPYQKTERLPLREHLFHISKNLYKFSCKISLTFGDFQYVRKPHLHIVENRIRNDLLLGGKILVRCSFADPRLRRDVRHLHAVDIPAVGYHGKHRLVQQPHFLRQCPVFISPIHYNSSSTIFFSLLNAS